MSSSQERISELESQNAALLIKKEELDQKIGYSNREDEIQSRIKLILAKYFSQGQITSILKDKKIQKWSSEDIASAITFRSISSKVYRHFLEKKVYFAWYHNFENIGIVCEFK